MNRMNGNLTVSSPQKDMLQILKDKLQTAQKELEKAAADRDQIKQVFIHEIDL